MPLLVISRPGRSQSMYFTGYGAKIGRKRRKGAKNGYKQN